MAHKKQRVSNYLKVNGSFLQLPHKTILSKEYQSLKYSTRCIYEVLLVKWSREKEKAERNIIFTYEEIAFTMTDNKGHCPSSKTISEALRELEDSEFIYVTYGGKNNPNKYKINTKWLT